MKLLYFLLLINSILLAQVKDIFVESGKVMEYIASNQFSNISENNELAKIDSIFSFALLQADSNISDALLFAAIGTIPYVKFPVEIPIFNIRIRFLIFNKIDYLIFNKKMKNLPAKLFEDSPIGEFGDKDKLTHFFISAFLAYSLTEKISLGLGKFVEAFENDFKVDGKEDERDLKMNYLGVEFGNRLKDKLIFPSEIITKYKTLSYGKNINN